MPEMTDRVLIIVKQDLLIQSSVRDDYLRIMIQSCYQELINRGVSLSDSVDDILLLADYVSFRYRHRTDNSPIPQNLQLRIYNKKLQGRLAND